MPQNYIMNDTLIAQTSAPSTVPNIVIPMPFSDLPLSEPIQRALAAKKYTTPSPIQAQSIPHLLAGKDLLGCAQTGTGKTAAFALPILQRLSEKKEPTVPFCPKAVILSPTRELAVQIARSFLDYGKYMNVRLTCVYGGVSQYGQVRDMQRGVDILVATPGRLKDLAEQGYIKFDRVETFVLDEADRMLDMGFINDIKEIIAELPPRRQSLFFSATLSSAIVQLAQTILTNPVRVDITPSVSTAEKIDQRICFLQQSDKMSLLKELIASNEGLTLVFSRTKHGANKISEHLEKERINCTAIHGNKNQAQRERALQGFRTGRYRVLVATDVAARGIDVKGITLVVNFDLPEEPESYVHRIGRTARAGAEGLAIAFCAAQEVEHLHDVQKLIKKIIPVFKDHAWHSEPLAQSSLQRTETRSQRPPQRRFSRGGGGGGNRSRQDGPRGSRSGGAGSGGSRGRSPRRW